MCTSCVLRVDDTEGRLTGSPVYTHDLHVAAPSEGNMAMAEQAIVTFSSTLTILHNTHCDGTSRMKSVAGLQCRALLHVFLAFMLTAVGVPRKVGALTGSWQQ